MRRHRAALCIAESEKLSTPEVITAEFVYFRYRKAEYTASERAAITSDLARISGRAAEIYGFFKHLESPESALHAVDVFRQLSLVAPKSS